VQPVTRGLHHFLVALSLAVLVAGCPSRRAPPPKTKARPAAGVQLGLASWYGGRHHGGPTASGERFDKRALTAAHRTLRMNTRVRVTNRRNGKSVVLRINDRGPYVKGRIIDVSERAAELLGMKRAGVVPVKVEVLR
jgi:rare lipoprotein A